MKLSYDVALRIYEKADLCRCFETEVFRQVKLKNVNIPVYLSAGQEYISATISVILELANIRERQVFIQHRGHSTYISFGGNIYDLICELLGDPSGCANGMGGSASIHSLEANIYGHDGLMGSQGPIAVGMAFANKIPTLCFVGDAAAEEDYFLASLGWASTKRLPIIFVVEDNNLSILTEKKVRRNWEMHEIARGFKIKSFNLSDDPQEISDCMDLQHNLFSEPVLLNVNTHRLFWHAGAGIDSTEIFDRHKEFGERFSLDCRAAIQKKNMETVRLLWNKRLSL